MLGAIWKFINYWYFRYLLVTELHMVEKWERLMFHTVVLVIFALLYFFNSTVIMGLVSQLTYTLDITPRTDNAIHQDF